MIVTKDIIALRLREARASTGLTCKNAAQLSGVSHGSIANFENRYRWAPVRDLDKLAEAYGVSIIFLLGLEPGGDAAKRAPHVERAAMTYFKAPKTAKAHRIDSEDMEPLLRKGDTVYIDTAMTDLNSPGIYAFLKTDTKIDFLKVHPYMSGGVRLSNGDNSFVEEVHDLTKLRVHGRVVWRGTSYI